jgi:tetratricopeptide (TPR) repeat protein
VAHESIRLAQLAGFNEGVVQGSFNLAMMYSDLGAPAPAEAAIHEMRAHLEAVAGGSRSWPLVEALWAYLHLSAGDYAAGQAAYERALASETPDERASRFPLTAAFFAAVDVDLALHRGDAGHALEVIEALVANLRQSRIRLFLPDALLGRGRALRMAGQTEAARAALAEARAEAEGIGSRRSLWRIVAEQAALEAERGDAAAAAALRRDAAAIVTYIADHIGPGELRESFMRLPAVRAVLMAQAAQQR